MCMRVCVVCARDTVRVYVCVSGHVLFVPVCVVVAVWLCGRLVYQLFVFLFVCLFVCLLFCFVFVRSRLFCLLVCLLVCLFVCLFVWRVRTSAHDILEHETRNTVIINKQPTCLYCGRFFIDADRHFEARNTATVIKRASMLCLLMVVR